MNIMAATIHIFRLNINNVFKVKYDFMLNLKIIHLRPNVHFFPPSKKNLNSFNKLLNCGIPIYFRGIIVHPIR